MGHYTIQDSSPIHVHILNRRKINGNTDNAGRIAKNEADLAG
jgi:hypothetical protein